MNKQPQNSKAITVFLGKDFTEEDASQIEDLALSLMKRSENLVVSDTVAHREENKCFVRKIVYSDGEVELQFSYYGDEVEADDGYTPAAGNLIIMSNGSMNKVYRLHS